MRSVGWKWEGCTHDKGLQKVLDKFLSSSGNYSGLKGVSRSLTNPGSKNKSQILDLSGTSVILRTMKQCSKKHVHMMGI